MVATTEVLVGMIVVGEVVFKEAVCSFAVAAGGTVLGDDDDVPQHPATKIVKATRVKEMIDILSIF